MNTASNNKPAFELARVSEGGELRQQTEIIMLNSEPAEAPGGAMSRRDFLGAGITAAAAVAFLGGCGRGGEPEPETIIAETQKRTGARAPAPAVLRAHKGSVNSIHISPDGMLLVSASADKTIKLWNLRERVLIKTLQGFDHSVCIIPSEKLLVSGSADRTIKLWSLPDGDLLKTLAGHTNRINSLCTSADTKLLASGSADRTIRLWSLPDGELIKTLTGHAAAITSVCISPDGKWLASGSEDKTIRLWSLPDGALVKTMRRSSDFIRPNITLSIIPDGTLLVSHGWDENIRLWSLPEGKLVKTLKGHKDRINSVVTSPDGKWLASGGGGREITPKPSSFLSPGRSHGWEDGIRLWSLPDGRPLKLLKVEKNIAAFDSLRTSPGGEWLVFLDGSPDIGLLNLPDGASLKTLEGHTERVNSICASPDGKLLASGSRDKTIRLWSLPGGEFVSCLPDLADNPESVKGAVFSVTSETGQTVTYTLPCGAAIPAGAVCACNCVPGSMKPPAPPAQRATPKSGASGGGGGCRHGTRCVCMAVRCRRT